MKHISSVIVTDDCSPLAAAHSAPPEYFPRRTSFPDSDVRSTRGSSAACRQGACGRTCTAPPAYTATTKQVLHLENIYNNNNNELTRMQIMIIAIILLK